MLEDLHGLNIMLYQDPKRFPYVEKLEQVNCHIGTQMWHEENLILALALDKSALAFRPSRLAEHNRYVEDGKIAVRSVIDCPMPVDLCLMWPTVERMTRAEALFFEELKRYFPDYRRLYPTAGKAGEGT